MSTIYIFFIFFLDVSKTTFCYIFWIFFKYVNLAYLFRNYFHIEFDHRCVKVTVFKRGVWLSNKQVIMKGMLVSSLVRGNKFASVRMLTLWKSKEVLRKFNTIRWWFWRCFSIKATEWQNFWPGLSQSL